MSSSESETHHSSRTVVGNSIQRVVFVELVYDINVTFAAYNAVILYVRNYFVVFITFLSPVVFNEEVNSYVSSEDQ